MSPSLITNLYRGLFPVEVKRPELDADIPLLQKLKMRGDLTYFKLPTCFLGIVSN
jgi:hypothetical protein